MDYVTVEILRTPAGAAAATVVATQLIKLLLGIEGRWVHLIALAIAAGIGGAAWTWTSPTEYAVNVLNILMVAAAAVGLHHARPFSGKGKF